MKILAGIDDIPSVAQDRRYRCESILTKQNFAGWFGFIKNHSQMYTVPYCDSCFKEDNKNIKKEE